MVNRNTQLNSQFHNLFSDSSKAEDSFELIEKRRLKQVLKFHNKAAGYWWGYFTKNLYCQQHIYRHYTYARPTQKCSVTTKIKSGSQTTYSGLLDMFKSNRNKSWYLELHIGGSQEKCSGTTKIKSGSWTTYSELLDMFKSNRNKSWYLELHKLILE